MARVDIGLPCSNSYIFIRDFKILCNVFLSACIPHDANTHCSVLWLFIILTFFLFFCFYSEKQYIKKVIKYVTKYTHNSTILGDSRDIMLYPTLNLRSAAMMTYPVPETANPKKKQQNKMRYFCFKKSIANKQYLRELFLFFVWK